jgi:hypothetical protein
MTASEYLKQFRASKDRRKYRNKPTWHDSPVVGLRRYDSKKEAAYAAGLDRKVAAGLNTAWWPQVPLYCGFDKDDGSPVRMVIDFKILRHGESSYVDVKGLKPTKDWEIKRKAVEQRYGITVETA